MIDIQPFVDALNEGIENTDLTKEQKKKIIDFNNAHVKPEVKVIKKNDLTKTKPQNL